MDAKTAAEWFAESYADRDGYLSEEEGAAVRFLECEWGYLARVWWDGEVTSIPVDDDTERNEVIAKAKQRILKERAEKERRDEREQEEERRYESVKKEIQATEKLMRKLLRGMSKEQRSAYVWYASSSAQWALEDVEKKEKKSR